MLDYLRSFAYIEAIEQTGSIRNAAKALYITPSALDRRLHELEHELGMPLFERHARGMRVTEAGRIFMHHMRAHRADSERMRMELDRLRGLQRGSVRIGASQAAASTLLPDAILAFQTAWPGIAFQVRVSTHAALLERLRRFDVDLALVYGLPENDDLDTLRAMPQQLYAVMRASHPLARAPAVRIDDCVRHPLALPDASLGLRRLLNAEIGAQNARPTIVLESDSLELLRQYVLGSDAVTFQIAAGVESEPAGSGLAARPLARRTDAPSTLCVIQLRGRTLPHAAVAFAHALVQRLERDAAQGSPAISAHRD